MIQAKELRIGNWVGPTSPRYGERYLEIESISNDSVNLEFREYRISEIRPIPLTPEIIEKCGFPLMEFTNNVKFISLPKLPKPLCFVFVDDHFILSLKQDVFPYLIDLQARGSHLHHLQNLYFALTGEELTVNL